MHPKGRAPYNPHSPQPAACTSSRLHLASVFQDPRWWAGYANPLPRSASTWRQHRLPLHQSSGAPVRDTSPRTRLLLGFRIQMKTTSALPGYLIFLLWGAAPLLTSAQPWPLSFQLLGPFALAGHRATSMPSLIQMSSPNGLHPKRALGSVHWAS